MFVAVTSSTYVTCGLTAAGDAYCWGHPSFVGDGGTHPNTFVPVPVTGGHTFAMLSGSPHVFVCGVTTNGAAYCWGFSSHGQLGDGTNQDRSVPTPVAGGLTFRAVSAGLFHACGVTTSDAAYCWGWNQYGQMGDGTIGTDHLVPTPVGGGLTFATVSAGGSHSCGVTTSNAVYCWGYNGNGTLGDGTTTNRLVPTAVASP
jgi:alpha-tubulin suppressor-like RCC1 family protein